MDWHQIEAMLCERAEEVCRHLLPQGKRVAGEYQCGDLSGKAGDSLRVNLAGKVGFWRDFAGDKGGKTLMSLWCSVRSQPFRVCIGEAKALLGVRDDYERRVARYPAPAGSGPGAGDQSEESRHRTAADSWAKCQALTEGGPVWNYLVVERRIEPAVLGWFEVREMISHSQWVMVFPYWKPAEAVDALGLDPAAGRPDWLKFELLERPNGKKREWTTPGPEKTLWGTRLTERKEFAKCDHVLVCEGEKDALSWASYGCAAWGVLPVSVPFGAKWKGQVKGQPSPNREWLDRDWEWLEGFETVFVAMDADEAGRRAAADIIGEIGPRRCRLVELPLRQGTERYKDVNDCLKAGVPASVIEDCLKAARDFAPEKVVHAATLEKEFLSAWFDELENEGCELPFEFPWRIRPGELTIWTGIEKSGKTTLLGHVLMGLLQQGERAFVASLECRYTETLKKYSRQAFGALPFDKRVLKKCAGDDTAWLTYMETAKAQAVETFRWLSQNLWIYKHVGIAPWGQLLEDMRWARRRHGITQFVLDNFMRLGIAKDDYAQQADAITVFTAAAMDLGVHLHLVVHQNKAEGRRGEAGGKRTVSGAYEIIANAHNIVEVQRDERKGEKVSELWEKRKIGQIGEAEFAAEKSRLDLVPDGKFVLHAQRNGDVQNGSKYLWFLWESQQYCDVPPTHNRYGAVRFSRGPEAKQNELPSEEELGM